MTIAAFSHKLFEVKPTGVLLAQKEHNSVKYERNLLRDKLIKLAFDYRDNKISLDDFNKKLPTLTSEYQIKKEKATNLYEKYKVEYKKHNIFGFKTYYHFLYTLGLPLNLLMIALILLFLSIKHQVLKSAFTFLASTILFIGLFYISWIFLPKSDFPFVFYAIAIFIVSVLISIALRNFFKWRET